MVKTTQNNWVPMMPLHDGGNRLYTKQDLDRVVADARKEGYEEGQISERKNHIPQMLLDDNVWSIKTVMTNGKQILTNQRFMREHEWYEFEILKTILSHMSNELIESFRKHLAILRKEQV